MIKISYTVIILSSLLAAGVMSGGAGANTDRKYVDRIIQMKQIPLSGNKGKGYFAIVDDEDYDKCIKYKWNLLSSYKTNIYYAKACISWKPKVICVLLHRLILDINDIKITIDHINHNGLDNRKCNLRIATRSQNAANRIHPVHNKSGYKGVSFDRFRNKYAARIKCNKIYCLGRFNTAIEAAKAYNEAAIKLFGDYAYLNVIHAAP